MRRKSSAFAAPAKVTVTSRAAAAATGIAALSALFMLCICTPWAAGPSAGAATLAAPTTATAPTSAPDTSQTPAGPTITRSAHIRFQNCNAQHITLSVTVPRHAFTPTQPVPYTVRLRNTGSTACGGGSLPQQSAPTRRQLMVGPCGPLTMEIRNATGVDVYPGPVVYFCPNETGVRLGPHSSASSTETWNQSEALGSSGQPAKVQHAPPGAYRLTVDRAVTVPVTLTPG